MDWEGLKLDRLARHLRGSLDTSQAERMIQAFEQAVRIAQLDAELLPHLLAATACMIAHEEASSPRTVLETYFRRSVSDERWRDLYLPLFE